MLLYIKITPNAKKAEIRKISEGNYEIKIDAPPEKGKANMRLIEILSEHFGVPKPSITIIRGHKSRNKIIGIST